MKIIFKVAIAACILGALSAYLLISPKIHKTETYRPLTMQELKLGTFFEITVEDGPGASSILKEAFIEIERLENIFSIYKPSSEVSILNSEKEVRASPELLSLLNISIEISALTGGAFDITCKPLLDLYERAGETGFLPGETEIEDALQSTGWERISRDPDIGYISIPAGFQLDFGAIAKGYIVDRTADFLKKRGIRNGLINAGGDIYCFGKNKEGSEWVLGLRDPSSRTGIIGKISVTDKGVATSGGYERFFTIGGKSYPHIICPATGQPVKKPPASVTVIGPDCATADALATAFFVLSPGESIKLSEQIEGVETLIINSEGFVFKSTGMSDFTLP